MRRTQPRILHLCSRRRVGIADVARELDITDRAAVDCLQRLWQLKLIAPIQARPRGFKWRPTPEEQVAKLRFKITSPRGEKKLAWWKKEDSRWLPW